MSSDRTVKIWDPKHDWSFVRNYTNHSDYVRSLEYINEDTIATGSWDKTIQIWSMSTGLTIRIINAVSSVYSLKMLSNGYHLAAGIFLNINIYNAQNGSLIAILNGHSSSVNDLVLIGSDLMASSSGDQTIGIWNLTTNKNKFFLTGHTDWVYALKLVYFDIIASGSWDNTIKIWNTTNGKLIRTLTGHTNSIWYGVDALYDGQILVSGSYDRKIKLWNWRTTGQSLNSFDTGVSIQALAVLNSSKFFISI